MKKILVISHACFTAINRHVYNLFIEDGWDLELVVPESLSFPSGKKKADPPEKGDPEIHYLLLKGTNPRSYHFEGLIELLNEKKPVFIILDNDPVSMLATQLGRWSRQNRALLFCISNENLPLDMRSSLARRGVKALPAIILKRILLKRNRKLVSGVFTVNRDGENIFIKEGFQNVQHMPLGFDPVIFFPDSVARERIRRKYGLTETVFAYFGRLTKEKGVHILIQALSGIKSTGWQLMMDSFDIYASEYNTEVSRLLSEAGLLSRVVFINANHYEIAAFMNAADIVVVPSVSVTNWKEQYGRVAAEALACGKEVIASDSGALPELLGGQGYLFKEGSVGALQELLEARLLANDESGESSRVNSSYALKNLSIQKQKAVLETALQ